MAKADREPIVLYRVWCPNDGDEDDGRDYGALDIERAAQLYADFCYRRRDGWEWKWPQTFRVRDPATGKVYDVEVDMDTSPVFIAGKPVEVA